MSTRLLSVQGKIHELSDDLESHFFVLLFEGLHFVEHTKPYAIDMQALFDQATVDPKTGNHSGGQGKVFLYSNMFDLMNRELEFTSKPFTTLIRGLYRLFASLHDYHAAKVKGKVPDPFDVNNVKKLEGCLGVEALFDEARQSKEWPTKCDKVLDQYPPTKHLNSEQKDTVALSYLNQSLVPVPSSGKRKRESESGIRRSTRAKRSQVGPYQ